MAQVRKFQDGGKTFTLGGYTFNTNNAEDMKMLEEMASNSTYGGIAQSVLDNVRNGSYANTLKMYRTADGRVVMEGGLQDVADQHLSSGTQKALQRKDTYINNLFKRQSAKDWANNTDAFLSEISRRKNSKNDVSDSDNKKKITGVSDIAGGQWVYTPDNKWSTDSPDNSRMLTQLRYLEEYFNASEDDRKKYYDVTALDPDALEGWLTWRSANAAFNPDLFKEGALKISDDDPFYSQYRWFGFTPGTKAQREARAAQLTAEQTKQKLNELGLTWNGVENDFHVGSDGAIYVNDDFLTRMGLSGSTGYWFNDDWNSHFVESGETNPHAQLLNHIIWNGKLYNQNDATLHNLLKSSQYDELMGKYNFTEANKILKSNWTDGSINQYQNYINQEGIYHPALFGKNIHLAQLKSKNPNNVLIEYLVRKPNDPFFGYEKAYGLLGTSGIKALTLDQAKDRAILENDRFTYQTAPTFGSPLNSNNIYENLDYSNNTKGARLFHNPYTNEYYVYGPHADGGEHVYKIPKSISDKFTNEFWNLLRQNPELLGNLTHAISWLGTKDRDINTSSNVIRNTHGNVSDNSLWRTIMDIIADINMQNNNVNLYVQPWDPFIQSFEITDTPVQSNKKGGILKFNKGGIGRESFRFKKYTTPQPKKDDKKKEEKWTNTDWWDFGAACADGLSALATLIDPTNISGAITGIGGTVAGFTADVKRDGFDFGDVGRGLLNLGGDVITLIPGVGDIVAIPKLAEKFKTIAWLLRKGIQAGAITGVGQALIVGIDRIAKGESLSASDYRAIANGLQGLSTITKLGAKAAPTKKVTKNLPEFKNSNGETIVLSAEATKNIKTAKPSEQLLQTQIELTTEYRKQNPNTTLSDDQILEQFAIPTARKWAFKKENRYEIPTNLEPRTGYRPLDATEYSDFNAGRGKLWQWWNGTGNMQRGIYKGNGYVISGQNAFSGGSPMISPVQEPESIQYLSPEEFFGYYKKGGILKGQDGLTPWATAYNIGNYIAKKMPVLNGQNTPTTTTKTNQTYTPSFNLSDGMIVGNINVAKVAGDAATEKEFKRAKTPSFKTQYATNFGSDAADAHSRTSLVTTPTKPVTTDPFSARVGSDNNYLKQSEILGDAHFINTLGRIYQQKRLGSQFGDKYADALGERTVHTPNIKINNRFIDPRSNELDRLGAQYLTQANQFKTADSGLNVATKFAGINQWNQLMSNKIDQQSVNRNQQLDRINQTNMQQELYNSQSMNQRNEFMVNAELARLGAINSAEQQALLATSNAIDNKVTEKRTKLNRLGQTQANLEMQAMKYDEMAAAATDEKTKNYYQEMATRLRDKSTLDMYLNVGGYSVPSAKRGAKLRPIHEQMLIDKQKLVARAIEKINDNTMKILLKAMS